MNIEKADLINLINNSLYSEISLKCEEEIITKIKLFFKNDQRQIYDFLYDIMCDYLDNEFKKHNYCDFQNDKCIANRESATVHETMGCCYSFDYNKIRFSNVKLCKHMINRNCDVNCIGCKLWTCKYLRKKKISFTVKNIPISRGIFNKKQQAIIENNLFKTKEQIIDKLLEKNNMPYFIYFILEKYII